jgi:hypothetical protein
VEQFERAQAKLSAVRQLRRWTVFGLLCTGIAAVVALLGATLQLFALDDMGLPSGTPVTSIGDSDFFALNRFATRSAGALLVILAFTGALFLAWLWKARELTGDLRNRVSEGDAWVTLGWLPFVNLVVPYSIVSGLYGDTDPDVSPGDVVEHRSGRAWWLLALWWMPSFVVLLTLDLRLFAVVSRPVRLVAPHLAGADVGTITSTLFVDVIVLACMAMASLGAVLVVRRITTRLEQCVARFGLPVVRSAGDQSLVTAAASQRPE